MYNIIICELPKVLQDKLNEKLQSDKDPLNVYQYLDNVINLVIEKTSLEEVKIG